MTAARCSFCGKTRETVDYLVAGPDGLSICSECAELASRVAGEAFANASRSLLLTGISQTVTNDRRLGGLLGRVSRAAIAIRDGRISWLGPESDLPRRYRDLPERDCGGRAVVPGFIDAGTRLVETEADFSGCVEFAGMMLGRGTTAFDVSVGGSTDPDVDARVLAVAAAVADRVPATVSISWIVSSSSAARSAGAAARVAAFAELVCPGDGSAAELSRTVAPLRSKLKTCAQPRCVCSSGFEPVSSSGPKMLDSGAIPVIRPGGSERFAVDLVRRIVEDGRAVAMASDSSPNGLRIEGIPFLIAAAVECAGMPFEVALWAATRGGALALNDPERGRLRLGAHADLVVLEGSEPESILDRPDGGQASMVVLDGAIVPR